MRAIGLLVALGLICSAHSAAADDKSLSAQELHGKQVYGRTCIYCHGPGVWGTNRLAKRVDKDHAQLETRTDLSAATIRTVVRTGIGSMPPLRRTELSDADVDAIAAYLTRQGR